MPHPFNVSRETQARLDAFLALLQRWNARQQLVSSNDIKVLPTRHLADSLALAPFLPSDGSIADFGAGAGFPGLVISIALERHVLLIESNRRKAAFLREAIRVSAALATVHAGRIESVTNRFDTILARAVAPLTTLLEMAYPRMAQDARCLFPKGRSYQQEIEVAARDWEFAIMPHLSSTDTAGRILDVTAVSRR